MGTVQRYPSGLLELLSAKTSGWTPGDVHRDVSLGIEMLEFFGQNDLRHVTATNSTAAEGDSAVITVPDQQWWLLHAAGVEYEKTATMTLLVASIRINPQGSVDWCTVAAGPTPDQAFGSTPATQVNACVFVPPKPWILAPGTQIFGRVDVLGTDPTVDIGINARVSVLT